MLCLGTVNVFLCKPWRFQIQGADRSILSVSNNTQAKWVSYSLRILEPLLQFLPTILARWIVDNLFKELNLPPPGPIRAGHTYWEDHRGLRWSVQDLNWVLQRVLREESDGSQLRVIGGIEHESELFEGTPQIRCRSNYRGTPRKVKITLHMFTHVDEQDCFATIPPFPYYEGDPDEFHIVSNMEDVLYGRPILMFSCIFHPCGRPRVDTSADFKCKLVFFSAFQDLELESERGNPMQELGGIKLLYKPGP